MYGPGYRGGLSKCEEGVDTLQAAEPPCSVSNGPVKINLKTSVSGGLSYKIKQSITKYMLVYKRAYHNWIARYEITENLRASPLRRLRS